MKKSILILSAACMCLGAFAQTAPTRDLSRYANDSFKNGEEYQVEKPYETVTVTQPRGKKVKNVILMIGDGMGLEQISCAWVLNGGHLNIDNCKYTGLSLTYAANKLVTDSPAGGTGLAIGEKTKYGYVGINAQEEKTASILEVAQQAGKKTGLAVTCRINDATPAGFCCHSKTRDRQAELAAEYVDSNVDFISGGGWYFWQNRDDGRDLIAEMQAKGYSYVNKAEDIASVKFGKFLGLFAPLEMKPALDRGPILEETAMKAIELLDNKKGFFLMIEGSSIDDYCHNHKIGYSMEELFDFDRTIGKVLKWAEKDGETLVVIVADHSTGGLTLINGSLPERSIKVHFSTGGHNGIAVPVFAYGPHAEDFVGTHENSEISAILKELVK